MEKENDNFKTRIKKIGNSSLMIIIPYNVVEFGGYKEGDTIKAIIKKIEASENV